MLDCTCCSWPGERPGDHAYLKKTFSQFMPTLRLGTCDTDGMEPEQDHYTPVSIHPGAVRQ
jgi:hypothetical protein